VTVSLFTFNCPAFKGSLLYHDWEGDNKEHKIASSLISDSLYRFSLDLPPGHHEIWLNDAATQLSREPSCTSFVPFTVLDSRDRHLAVVLGQSFTPHSYCALAGTLPVAGMNVDLVLPKGHLLANSTTGGYLGPASQEIYFGAIVDGDAYYVESILPLDFILRISMSAPTPEYVDIPLNLTKQADPTKQYCRGVFIRNITSQEMKQLFPISGGTE
jgi:hypothetical protein